MLPPMMVQRTGPEAGTEEVRTAECLRAEAKDLTREKDRPEAKDLQMVKCPEEAKGLTGVKSLWEMKNNFKKLKILLDSDVTS